MRFISQKFKANVFVKMLGLIKIPLMHFCRPKILYIDDDKVIVRILLRRRTKNHIGSMYFGALSVGADLTGGYLALHHTNKINRKINLLFKDFNAEFLKRAEGDVHFECNEGQKIKALIQKVIDTKTRCNEEINVIAYVPSMLEEPVARFKLTLSLK
tara:strand:+ start:9878 stop:10348 length:471 start_codon:yes stop_codon:yes gene_type:complete